MNMIRSAETCRSIYLQYSETAQRRSRHFRMASRVIRVNSLELKARLMVHFVEKLDLPPLGGYALSPNHLYNRIKL